MTQTNKQSLSSFSLHILAMALMLCDHLWATMFPAQEWMTCLGRVAFPLFAFMIVEGYVHTSNVRRYMGRMLIFAVLSEIPFDLIYGSSVFYPFHQNVLWTFLIALALIRGLDTVRKKGKRWQFILAAVAAALAGYVLGSVTMVDYFGAGVLTVLVFYLFRGRSWVSFFGQLLCLAILHIGLLGSYYYPLVIGGCEIKIVQQGFALLALIPIWLYRGRQGHHSKAFQYACYGFYPVHLLLLYGIWQWTA
nr:TraX family protein [uncultured Flavonifractor sp.]